MTRLSTSADGTTIAYEVKGEGIPVLFIHEFAGDMSSWEGQVEELSAEFKCIRYAARGYHPSEIPEPGSYSQQHAVQDVLAVLDAEGIEAAHIVGLSMGGYTTANITASHPDRVLSATVAGCGWGSDPDTREKFVAESMGLAARLRESGWSTLVGAYAAGPTRIQLRIKDEKSWEMFRDGLARHSSEGSACTMEGVQSKRPSLDELIPGLREAQKPILILTGDEDDGCIEANFRLKKALPTAAWKVFPNTGHTINLEEPEEFNRSVRSFVLSVHSGRWNGRHPAAMTFSSTGLPE